MIDSAHCSVFRFYRLDFQGVEFSVRGLKKRKVKNNVRRDFFKNVYSSRGVAFHREEGEFSLGIFHGLGVSCRGNFRVEIFLSFEITATHEGHARLVL